MGGNPITIPIHVAAVPPERRTAPAAVANSLAQDQSRVADEVEAAEPAKLGIEIRWLGEQTDDCLAAIHPSRFFSRGAQEFDRFLDGARHRGDVAVTLFTIAARNSPRSVLAAADKSVMVDQYTSVLGTKVGAGTLPNLANDLDTDDKDLANRLLQTIGASDQWLALSLSGAELEGVAGIRVIPPEGRLVPLLTTRVGEPVAAFWQPDDGSQRVYVLPAGHDWGQTLSWLVARCLPRQAQAGLREIRRDLLPIPHNQLSRQEQAANERLADLEQRYTATIAVARRDAEQARQEADAIRDPLLYETGKPLETAVAKALTDAGLAVQDLDQCFGDTISADLLVTDDSRRVLVEVKATGGRAPEDLVDKLTKHLTSWPALAPDEPVDRGVLVVNHQTRIPPSERSRTVYERPEFTGALQHIVLSSVQLLDWWLAEDWSAIRNAFIGPPETMASDPLSPPKALRPSSPSPTQRWRLRGRQK